MSKERIDDARSMLIGSSRELVADGTYIIKKERLKEVLDILRECCDESDSAIQQQPLKVYTCNVYQDGKVLQAMFVEAKDAKEASMEMVKTMRPDERLGDFRRVE